MLGLAQWFCILSRPHFGCFNQVYRFARVEPTDVIRDVPVAVLRELSLFCVLAPLIWADLSRVWEPELFATDAAPEYGMGVSWRRCDLATVQRLGTKAEKRGDFVRLNKDGLIDVGAEKPRPGSPVHFPLHFASFAPVLSLKARYPEHSSSLELRGVLLGLRWALRSQRRFGRRLLFLIDAKAALAAVAKGRSGAWRFRRPLGAINALLLATDTLFRPLYIPSEDNPVDLPSRGVRQRPTVRRKLLSMRKTGLKRCL